ncbi:MAG: helix-turn-helix transcriptional regulator [Weeksellaceae bacterium]|nr:helix-turn-helix transcriptional regulator [Weeksellaceae bacterium]
MIVKAFIEIGKDGLFGIYLAEDNKLPFGLMGTGDTVAAAKEDFDIAVEEMKQMYEEEKRKFPLFTVEFAYDVASFLQYYNQFMSLAGMQRLTGVSQGQLSHYINGYRKPSAKTAHKIQSKIHAFGKELQQLHFV